MGIFTKTQQIGQDLVDPRGRRAHPSGRQLRRQEVGMTTDEAAEEIRDVLLSELNSAEVAVNLFQASGQVFVIASAESLGGEAANALLSRKYRPGWTLDG